MKLESGVISVPFYQFIGSGITREVQRDGRVEEAGRNSATEIYQR
jgi:hypothetical protein